MSSEMPGNERNTELRRMLVATASAAPERPRRLWRTAGPITAFALAGALTGTVSAAALNAPRNDRPATTDNMVASFVHDDTQLFGEPVEVNGLGDTVIPLGAAPADATELAVVFSCTDPGNFELLLNGEAAMTMICDEASAASAGGGSYFTVDDMPTHALLVSADEGDRYLLWASWASRAVPPEPSPQQAAAVADGEVSEEEYHAQFDRYSDCNAEAGYPLEAVNTSDTVITYNTSDAAITSGAEGRCYALEFAQVDRTWQAAHSEE